MSQMKLLNFLDNSYSTALRCHNNRLWKRDWFRVANY